MRLTDIVYGNFMIRYLNVKACLSQYNRNNIHVGKYEAKILLNLLYSETIGQHKEA